jgi:hypothetical protein
MLLALHDDLAERSRAVIIAHATAALGSEAAQQVAMFPTEMSRYVPPPDVEGLDLDGELPAGQFQILVWKDQANVVQTARSDVSEQLISRLVANAEALRDLATYVVLAAGGEIAAPPRIYAAPDWLIRQIMVS